MFWLTFTEYIAYCLNESHLMPKNNEIGSDFSFLKRIENPLTTNLSNAKSFLKSEFSEMSPEVTSDLENLIKNSKVDRTKFRDLFFINRKNIKNGEKEIVSYDIKERIIPREPQFSMFNDDFYLKLFFILIILLLSGLVFATTLKVYQNIKKIENLQNEKN